MSLVKYFIVLLATIQFVPAQSSAVSCSSSSSSESEILIKPLLFIQQLKTDTIDYLNELITDIQNDFLDANSFFIRNNLESLTLGFSHFLTYIDNILTPEFITANFDMAYKNYRHVVSELYYKGKDGIVASLCPTRTTKSLNAFAIELEGQVSQVVKSLNLIYRAEVELERIALKRSFRAIQNKVNSCLGIELIKSIACLDIIITEDGPKVDNLASQITIFFPNLFESYFYDLKEFMDEIAAKTPLDFNDALNIPCYDL